MMNNYLTVVNLVCSYDNRFMGLEFYSSKDGTSGQVESHGVTYLNTRKALQEAGFVMGLDPVPEPSELELAVME